MTSHSLQTTNDFAQTLLEWFDQHGRKDLPWQIDKTPYRVWVSEIMLQQTQVSAVIAYYQNFMAHFPDLETLASANIDSVLQHWAGLGYYARARNLHKAAQQIISEFAGEFPDKVEGLLELPGIGRSTAGAIMSIAFRKPAAILDGNVKRVLCRIQGITGWPGKKDIEQTLWQLAEALTPEQRVDDYTQAIMDLGATLCTRRKPQCTACPFQTECQAMQQGLQNSIPAPKPKKTIPTKALWITRIESKDGALLLQKRPDKGIWGGLYSLPEFSTELDQSGVAEAAARQFGFNTGEIRALPEFHHVFSHYKLKLKPLAIKTDAAAYTLPDEATHAWHHPENLSETGLPAPIKKFLARPIETDKLDETDTTHTRTML